MKLFSSFLIPALVVSVCGASHALQGPPPAGHGACLPFEPANTIEWPSTGHGFAASFGRAVIGHFSSASDTDRDTVIVAGGVAVHSRNTATYKQLAPITFPTQAALLYVADVAVLPGGGAGGTDTLLATDWRGLLRTTFRNGTFLNPVVIENDDWIDAAPIHVVDADGQGGLDVIGVSADGTQVLVLLANGSGYTESAFTMPDPILDVVSCNYDNNGARELVVLTTEELSVCSLAGVPGTLGTQYAASSGAIARLAWREGSGQAKESVAWGRPKASGGGELLVLNSAGVDSTVDLTFESCEPISFVPKAILAGNYDGNDDEDLVLVHEADQTAIVLVSKDSAPHFVLEEATHDVIPLSPAPGAGGGVGLPAFDQLDGDGVDDLVVPVRATGNVQVFLNTDVYHINSQGGAPTSKNVIQAQSVYFFNESEQLRFKFKVPQPYLGYEKVRLLLYEEPAAGDDITAAVMHKDHNLALEGGVVVTPTQYVDVEFGFPAGDHWSEIAPSQRPYFFIEVRFVDDTGAISPRYFAGLTLRQALPPTTPIYNHLLPGGIPPLLSLIGDSGSPGGSAFIGAYIPMNSLPAFANGDPPDIPDVSQGGAATFYTN